VHCRLHQVSVHQTSDQTRLSIFASIKIVLDDVHIFLEEEEVDQG
jgi:hypothetical protein